VTTPQFDPPELVGALVRHGVAFVVIGGVAAEAHGVFWMTLDLDVVIATTEENYAALVAALDELGAVFETFHTVPIKRIRSTSRVAEAVPRSRYLHGSEATAWSERRGRRGRSASRSGSVAG
jgi:hypothetical protein